MRLETLYEDKRGRIVSLHSDGKEYILLETRADYSRGGDYHKSTQHDVVLRGKIEWRERTGNLENLRVLEEGDAISIQSGKPHMFTSLEDSLVLEWLEGSFEKKYYKPYRDLIEERMKR